MRRLSNSATIADPLRQQAFGRWTSLFQMFKAHDRVSPSFRPSYEEPVRVMRLQIFQRGWATLLFLASTLSMVTAMTLTEPPSASAAAAKKVKKSPTPAEATAQRYAESMGAGNKIHVGQLDFACQYPLVVASLHGIKTYPPDSDPTYNSCWQGLKDAHAPTLVRSDVGMEILWPSDGNLVFFSEDLNRYPASAFVTDS